MVLNIDRKNERFSLGIKQLTPDPWKEVARRYRKGEVVTGKVTNLTDFGAFVELEEGIEGLIHVSEISREKVEKPSDVLKVGETVTAMILHIDPAERRIGLSMKSLKDRMEKAEVEKYMSNSGILLLESRRIDSRRRSGAVTKRTGDQGSQRVIPIPSSVAGFKGWKRIAHHASSLFLFSLRMKEKLLI